MTTTYRLGVLLGDGIGPEIVPASVRVVDAALAAAGAAAGRLGQELPLGASAIEEHGSALPAVDAGGARRARTAGCSARTTARPIRSRTGRSSTPAARCASTSTCTPTSGPRAAFEGGTAIAARTPTW